MTPEARAASGRGIDEKSGSETTMLEPKVQIVKKGFWAAWFVAKRNEFFV